MYTTVLKRIAAFLFGYRYYMNIVCIDGTSEAGISFFIFPNKEDALAHEFSLRGNSSYSFIERRTFFSRHIYVYRNNGTIGKSYMIK